MSYLRHILNNGLRETSWKKEKKKMLARWVDNSLIQTIFDRHCVHIFERTTSKSNGAPGQQKKHTHNNSNNKKQQGERSLPGFELRRCTIFVVVVPQAISDNKANNMALPLCKTAVTPACIWNRVAREMLTKGTKSTRPCYVFASNKSQMFSTTSIHPLYYLSLK